MPDSDDYNAVRKDLINESVRRYDQLAKFRQADLGHSATHGRKALEHPGIARLFDDGVTPDARPWFAMEYVDGIPLDAYATVRQLDMAARLHLFVRVCDVVEYAHR